jgi:hypothetical protein
MCVAPHGYSALGPRTRKVGCGGLRSLGRVGQWMCGQTLINMLGSDDIALENVDPTGGIAIRGGMEPTHTGVKSVSLRSGRGRNGVGRGRIGGLQEGGIFSRHGL